MHEGLRTICVPLSMPEAEVHARGEDCKNEDLKTYEGGVYEIHIQKYLQNNVHSRENF